MGDRRRVRGIRFLFLMIAGLAVMLIASSHKGTDANAANPAATPTPVPINTENITSPILADECPPPTSCTMYVCNSSASPIPSGWSCPGSDSANGTSPSSPFATVNHAATVAKAGDTVCIAPGVYNETVKVANSGTSNSNRIDFTTVDSTGAPVTSIPEAPAEIEQPAPAATPTPIGKIMPWPPVVFDVSNESYVTVNGLDISGGQEGLISACYTGSGGCTSGTHRCLTYNQVHGAGNFGIILWSADYDVVYGNEVYDNAKFSPPTSSYQPAGSAWWSGSGISVVASTPADNGAAWHNWVSHNVSYDNAAPHSYDGNGIIVDSEDVVPYYEPTLIEENTVMSNGGSGIKIYDSHNILVRNNTAWENAQDSTVQDEPWDLYDQPASTDAVTGYSNVWVNNIGVASQDVYSGAVAFQIAADSSNPQTIRNNLAFCFSADGVGETGDQCASGSFTSNSSLDNILGSNPLLIDAPGNLHLSSTSPALGSGTSTFLVPSSDADGNPLPSPPFIGAYACQGAGCPATPTPTMSPTATVSPTPTATPTGAATPSQTPTVTATPTATPTAVPPAKKPLTAAPKSLKFEAGGTNPLSVTVSNPSSNSGPVGIKAISVTDTVHFSASGCTSQVLPTGGSCSIEVTYMAPAPGTKSVTNKAKLVVTDSAKKDTLSVKLTGKVPKQPK
jgi:parallel beta-helix repeat protein